MINTTIVELEAGTSNPNSPMAFASLTNSPVGSPVAGGSFLNKPSKNDLAKASALTTYSLFAKTVSHYTNKEEKQLPIMSLVTTYLENNPEFENNLSLDKTKHFNAAERLPKQSPKHIENLLKIISHVANEKATEFVIHDIQFPNMILNDKCFTVEMTAKHDSDIKFAVFVDGEKGMVYGGAYYQHLIEVQEFGDELIPETKPISQTEPNSYGNYFHGIDAKQNNEEKSRVAQLHKRGVSG